MIHSINKVLAALVFFSAVVSFLTTCKVPTNQDSNVPDTVSYAKIFGEWEGAGVYNNPDEDSYESDSIYITHSEITEKKLR